MEEIFINELPAVSMAQPIDDFGLAALKSQAGFENYTPSFSVVDGPKPVDDSNKQIVTDAAKRAAMSFGLKQLGANQGLATLGSMAMFPAFTPIAALSGFNQRIQDSDFGRSTSLANYLAIKRARKAIQRNQDMQGDVRTFPTRIMNMEPSRQDIARGQTGSGKTSKSTSSKSKSTSYSDANRAFAAGR